jgi:hypothetical protein
VEAWRRLIGHDGYFIADLRLHTPAEGGRGRALQSGYHAQWWLIRESETWVGSGPIDLLEGRRSIKPGATGSVAIRPMDPSVWRTVAPLDVLHLRERVGQTLGVAVVRERIAVPHDAPLRHNAVPLRPGQAFLEHRPGLLDRVLALTRRGTREPHPGSRRLPP